MDLNHLHLHVRDLDRSHAFYETWFGFRERVRHGEIVFLSNDDRFDLALSPSPRVEPFPEWFHFGFRLASGDAVREIHRRMTAANVAIAKPLYQDDEMVSFRCLDPDGYGIEVYWE
jgi:catechol 2,3-dioxygenase-like lactoylglutathione lyase family enzyme